MNQTHLLLNPLIFYQIQPKGITVNDEQIMRMMEIRASDARSIILPFTLSHAAILIILGFGGDGLDNSGVQLAIAAMAVLGSLWCVAWLDDSIQDLVAGGKDLSDDFKNSHMGQRLVNAPIGAVRALNVIIVGLIVAAEMIALY